MAPHRVCDWAVTSDSRGSQGAQNGESPSAHSAPKASSPQSQWAGRAAAGQSPAEATQLSPQSVPGSHLPSCQHWQFYIPSPSWVYLWRCF